MFTLSSEITIGGKKFGGVHDVRIKRSIYELAARYQNGKSEAKRS